jgi:hypothetical protein
MYAIVKKVAKPPRISRPGVEPRSDMRNQRSSELPAGGGVDVGFTASTVDPDMVLL